MDSQDGDVQLQKIRVLVGRLLSKDTVLPDEDIYNAGLTSIMVLPLLAELEDSFQMSIPDDEFLNARTARELARMIQKLREH